MRVTVRFFAALRERAGVESRVVEDLPDGLSVGKFKAELAARHPELGSLEAVRGVLGNTYVGDDRPLAEGDELALLPPVSGGAPSTDARFEAGVFELVATPLDPGAALERVGHDGCGANVLFTGTTRDTNRGEAVVELDYEAFAEMAGVEMQRIFAECVTGFGPPALAAEPARRVLRMLVQHRSGVVGVGEPSVVVAVASPHRDAAFLAARFLIDELKARVPLWKKEIYAAGHHWINDRS
ncbi:MAG: molybdenum cofactor biosynthesis protein MoaE [Planctomycetota bacterium]